MAAGDLTTLANLKGYLGLTVTTDDSLLSRMITAYSVLAQTVMNRQIASQSYTERRSGAGGDVMAFANYPVTAVSAATINGLPIPAVVNFGDAGYSFDEKFIYLSGYCFSRCSNNVVLTYTAGYATTPVDLEEAVIQTVATRYKEKSRIGENSKSLAGETISYMVKDFSDSARTTLNNYRRVVPM